MEGSGLAGDTRVLASWMSWQEHGLKCCSPGIADTQPLNYLQFSHIFLSGSSSFVSVSANFQSVRAEFCLIILCCP